MRIIELLEDEEKKDPLDTIKSNVYGSESGYGKADTTKPNYAGALGPMQILPSTFDWMKSAGIIPKEYDIRNPEQNKEAGDALLSHYFKKYDGDPAKVYAAYYAGPGAVNKDGTINTHWRDLKNPKAPTVGQYIQSALAKSGIAGDSSTSRSQQASASPSFTDKISSTLASAGDAIRNTISPYFTTTKTSSNDNEVAPEEIEIVINGKKVRFKNKKDAMAAIAQAQQQGLDVQYGQA